jgi:DNA-binding beta-propeller fold protein YncE
MVDGPLVCKRWLRREVEYLAAVFIFLLTFAFGCGGGPKAKTDKASEKAPIGTGSIFFPPPPSEARLQYLTSLKTETDILTKEQKVAIEKKKKSKPSLFASFILGEDAKKKEVVEPGLVGPYSVAAHDGAIYVTDTEINKVVIFDLKHHRFEIFEGSRYGKFAGPISIFIEPDGTKYVTDRLHNKVLAFNQDNEFNKTYETAEMEQPFDVVAYGGRVYVSDPRRNHILIFDKQTGKLLSKFGVFGNGEGEFSKPSFLAVNSQGDIYVTDFFNFRIQQFDREGKFLSMYGEVGIKPGNFARPKGLSVDREGNIFVVDAAFENVQIFNKEWQLLMFFGKTGDMINELVLPSKVLVNYDLVPYFQEYADPDFEIEYIVLVSNQHGHKNIQVYGWGRLKVPAP